MCRLNCPICLDVFQLHVFLYLCVYIVLVLGFFGGLVGSSDEDMQSLASLMSMKQADIGNLDDFEEENEEDEENRVNQEEKAAKITGKTLEEHFFILLCKIKDLSAESH